MKKWLKMFFRKHWEWQWDGWATTCRCGYYSETDIFLEEHFKKVLK